MPLGEEWPKLSPPKGKKKKLIKKTRLYTDRAPHGLAGAASDMPPASASVPHAQNIVAKHTSKRRNTPSGDASRGQPPPKKLKTGSSPGLLQGPAAVKHALLAQYYPTILTLRQYLLDNLPPLSRLRRRKIATFGSEPFIEDGPNGVRAQLAGLLDTALVGLGVPPKQVAKAQYESRLQQWINYSQRDDSHVTLSSGDASAVHYQSEVGVTQGPRGEGSPALFIKFTADGSW